MREPACFMVLILGVILGCSKNDDFPSPAPLPASPNGLVQAGAILPALLFDKGGGKKADSGKKSKDEKNLPAGWYGDYAQALAKAKATGQPLLVLFH